MQRSFKNSISFSALLNGAFLVLIFSLGFMQPAAHLSNFRIPPTDFIFPFVFALWAAGLLLKKCTFRRSRFYLPLILYLFALGLSAAFSSAPRTSFFKFLGDVYLVGLAVLTFNLAADLSRIRKTIFVWLAASGVSCVVGILTVVLFYLDRTNLLLDYTLHYYGSLPPGNYPRIQSTFLYPSMLCNYLTVGVLMLFAAFKLGRIGRKVFSALLVLFTAAIAFTITPGIGGVLLAGALWCGLELKEKNFGFLSKACAAAGVFCAAAFLLVSTFTLRHIPTSPFYFTLPFFDLRIDPTQRLLTWQSALATFLNNPLTGRGLGTGAAAVSFLDPSENMQFLTDAHQTWLNVAAETGVIGLAAFCFVCIFFANRALPLKFAGSETQIWRTCFGVAFLGAFLYQGLVGSFENARHLWVLIGLLGSVSENASGGEPDGS